MFLDGYIGAPPTILVISAKAGATIRGAARPTPAVSAAAQHKILAFMVDLRWSFQPIRSVPLSIGTEVIRGALGKVSRSDEKKASNKNTVVRRNAEPGAPVLGLAPRAALRRPGIDVSFFRPAHERCADRAPHIQAFGRRAGLPLDQRDLLRLPVDERNADFQRRSGADLGAKDQFRQAVLLAHGPRGRQWRSDCWPDDDIRAFIRHDRPPGRLARRERRLGCARLSLLGDASGRSGSGDGSALALLLRLDPRAQRARLCRVPDRAPPYSRPLAEPGGLKGAPALDRRPRAAQVSQRPGSAALQRVAEARLSQRRHRLSDPHPRRAHDVARDRFGLSLAAYALRRPAGGA